MAKPTPTKTGANAWAIRSASSAMGPADRLAVIHADRGLEVWRRFNPHRNRGFTRVANEGLRGVVREELLSVEGGVTLLARNLEGIDDPLRHVRNPSEIIFKEVNL
jgi:hypothetical protein